MTITWDGIRDWDPAAVDDAAQQIKLRVDELTRLSDRLDGKHPANWFGDASDLAKTARTRVVGLFTDISHEADPLKRALWAAADAIQDLLRDQEEVEELARRHDLTITATGELRNGFTLTPGSFEAEQRDRLAPRLAAEITRIMAQANTIDENLASALRRAASPVKHTDANGNSSRLTPPPNGTPAEINDWWDGLSADERNELIATNPSFVGSTDGIPAEYRDTANRQLLTEQRADLNARLEALRNNGGDEDEIKALETRADALNDIQNRLDNPGQGQQDAYLLDIDTDAGQAIVAIGNPDTAANVATYVPGMGSSIDNMDSHMSRADSMARAADTSGSPSTSVIAWMGYDAPNGVLQASQSSYADNAQADLDRFQDGLRATHEGTPSHNTMVGHSYGSTVVGHTAAENGLAVDDIVIVGSPGVGVDTAAELGLPDGHVYATVAENDIINLANWGGLGGIADPHGPAPTGDEFGATVFESAPGTDGPFWQGGYSGEAHSQYWDDGNPALENMGLIIAGQPPV